MCKPCLPSATPQAPYTGLLELLPPPRSPAALALRGCAATWLRSCLAASCLQSARVAECEHVGSSLAAALKACLHQPGARQPLQAQALQARCKEAAPQLAPSCMGTVAHKPASSASTAKPWLLQACMRCRGLQEAHDSAGGEQLMQLKAAALPARTRSCSLLLVACSDNKLALSKEQDHVWLLAGAALARPHD